jgi:hypothetical protein
MSKHSKLNRDVLSNLEKTFIDLGNKIDEEYLKYYYSQEYLPIDFLKKENDYYLNLLSEIEDKNKIYLWYSPKKFESPNYCKLYTRLNMLLDILDYDISTRSDG